MVNSAETEKKSELANAMDAARFLLSLVLVVVITWLFLPVSLLGFIWLCCFIVLVVKEEERYRAEERSRMDDAERSRINTKRTFEEGESLRWLNEGVKRMWPMSTEFVSTYFFGPMASAFLDKYKPRGVVKEATIDIGTLCLGNTPPEFVFIKTLEQSMEGYDVAYEARMVFRADEHMTAQMKVVLHLLGTYNVYISRLLIEGTVRISAKFLKGWPFVKQVRFCFRSKPETVDMVYGFKFIRDVRNGYVKERVDRVLHKVLEDCFVEPNYLEVDVDAIARKLFYDSTTHKSAAGISREGNKATFRVEIFDATNLKVSDGNKLPYPIVVMQFGTHQKKKTRVGQNTQNPTWDKEEHLFFIESWDMPNYLVLSVKNVIEPSTELGVVIVAVNDYKNEPYHEFDEPLGGDDSGTGRLRFAITMKHSHPLHAVDEPRPSNAGAEAETEAMVRTVPLEIMASNAAVDYESPSAATTSNLKRSSSYTDVKRVSRWSIVKPGKGRKAKHGNETAEIEQPQAFTGEACGKREIVDMPSEWYPPGAIAIRHPGPSVPSQDINAVTIKPKSHGVDENGAHRHERPERRAPEVTRVIDAPREGRLEPMNISSNLVDNLQLNRPEQFQGTGATPGLGNSGSQVSLSLSGPQDETAVANVDKTLVMRKNVQRPASNLPLQHPEKPPGSNETRKQKPKSLWNSFVNLIPKKKKKKKQKKKKGDASNGVDPRSGKVGRTSGDPAQVFHRDCEEGTPLTGFVSTETTGPSRMTSNGGAPRSAHGSTNVQGKVITGTDRGAPGSQSERRTSAGGRMKDV